MKNWLPFEEAREIVRNSNVRTNQDYFVFLKGHSSIFLPYHPERTYKGQWISWINWTGKKRALRRSRFLSFVEAREYVRRAGIKTQNEWRLKCKELPSFIPHTPNQVYMDEWMGYGDWLGTKNTRGCYRTHTLNENYFKTWSHDMAYILGFWFADGSLQNKNGSKSFSITQHKDDKYILEDILCKMGSDHPLTKIRNCFDFLIGSKVIFDDIVRLGGKTKKSMDMEFPNIPEEYLADFIRGYFDGDGCIYVSRDNKKCCGTFVSGSLAFLKKLNEILAVYLPMYNNGASIKYGGRIKTVKERMAWIGGKYCKFRENYRLQLSRNDMRRLRDFIYADLNCMMLKRKYQKMLLTGEIKQLGGRTTGSKNKNHKVIEQRKQYESV